MANTTETTVIGAFRTSADAQAAAQDLQNAGVSRDDIYLEGPSDGDRTYNSREAHNEGGIAGWFKGLFEPVDDSDHQRYESAMKSGNFLLSVDVDESQVGAVEQIINKHSPVDVDSGNDGSAATAGTPNAAATETNTSQPRAEARPVAAQASSKRVPENDGSEMVPVVEENLQLGKRRVLSGGVRVYTRVVEKPVEENVSLREEHVTVDRRPVDREATEADLDAGREQVIEMEEFAEKAVVGKQSRVVEEVRVGKQVDERQETVHDTVRHTEVDVKQVDADDSPASRSAGSDYDADFRNDFQTRHSEKGESYDTYAPGYRYGSRMAADPRYDGRSFDDAQEDLRRDYERDHQDSTWEQMKDSVRYGWNKVTGQR